MMIMLRFILLLQITALTVFAAPERPNIVLVMADDQGWGQVGYNGHPTLKTPNLDAMARAGIRFNRFYAAGPVCSPTRASVLTGRTHNRTGVPSHGNNLCLQEKTLPQALKNAGYATGHFGKWHLNGVRGAGAPILKEDANHPGHYGFDEWLSVSNFFDLNPLMSRNGVFEEFKGDSSEIIVREALKFMEEKAKAESPFLAVIWYGSPHSPMRATPEDLGDLPDTRLGHHLGEIVGIDRSVGALRRGLRELAIETETLVWYCSDNGGLANIDPDACGGLSGKKGDVLEGGIRVPGIVEWPGRITPMSVDFPASTMDIMPTLLDLIEAPESAQLSVVDGMSLTALFDGNIPNERKAIPFAFQKQTALIDGKFKLVNLDGRASAAWKLYDLSLDPAESDNLATSHPERLNAMKTKLLRTLDSIAASAAGADYPEGRVIQPNRTAFWFNLEMYRPHFDELFQRPEYQRYKSRELQPAN